MTTITDNSIEKNEREKRSIKKKILLCISAVVVIISCIAIAKYAYRYYEENKVIINRNFNGLKFGEGPSQAKSIIGKQPDAEEVFNNEKFNVSYYSVAYGDKTIDTLTLTYYQQKLVEVIMIFNITHEDQERNRTFNRFKNLFSRKGYNNNQTYSEYDNLLKFEDKHTRLRLWHSFDEGDERWVRYNTSPRIRITYYDKDSGYREKMDSGF